METSEALGDREHFIQQLEILSETNRRLGQSNDELRNALSVSVPIYSARTFRWVVGCIVGNSCLKIFIVFL